MFVFPYPAGGLTIISYLVERRRVATGFTLSERGSGAGQTGGVAGFAGEIREIRVKLRVAGGNADAIHKKLPNGACSALSAARGALLAIGVTGLASVCAAIAVFPCAAAQKTLATV